MTSGMLDQARERFEGGDFRGAYDAAVEGLRQDADDVELLRLAGRAGVELGTEDAAAQLERVTALAPNDPVAWHDLGDALAADGRNQEARDAFAKAVELDPADAEALAQLGHSAAAAGDKEQAMSALSAAAEREPGTHAGSSAAISLVEMYRELGQPEEALGAAKLVMEAQPDDVVAALDVAELAVQVGQLDDAERAFERLRELDDMASHDVYALHGLVLVAMKRGELERALDIGRDALAVDELGRSADVVLSLELQTGGTGDSLAGRPSSVVSRVPPTPEELEAALFDDMVAHRRQHIEDRRPGAGDILG